jgi:hypothetical protein
MGVVEALGGLVERCVWVSSRSWFPSRFAEFEVDHGRGLRAWVNGGDEVDLREWDKRELRRSVGVCGRQSGVALEVDGEV